jgi:predicted butyrate kinase (DUF1464 family)
MADNVGYTPGNGAVVAADDVNGVLYQRVKVSLGDDGQAGSDLTVELLETLQALRITLDAMMRTSGLQLPDSAGRQRVLLDSITGGLTLATVTTVSTLQTAGTGNWNLNEALPALMKLQADCLRYYITVS